MRVVCLCFAIIIYIYIFVFVFFWVWVFVFVFVLVWVWVWVLFGSARFRLLVGWLAGFAPTSESSPTRREQQKPE